MALFEITPSDLQAVPQATFSAAQILERADLQRLLRGRIEVLADDVLIVAEEFGAFRDARRRIDLLGIDREGKLVVIELKRTDDGGHLELQALRYAAMVSAMTFDALAEHYERYLSQVSPAESLDARSLLADWLADAGGEDTVLSREVRIVLVAAGFDREITTAVLWLNDVYGRDITCVRLVPYKLAERILIDVQQVIPLPEAGELTVQLRRMEIQARASRAEGPDRSRYTIVTPTGSTQPLPKRRAILALVKGLHDAGVSGEQLSGVLPSAKFLSVDGRAEQPELTDVFLQAHARADRRRWFLDEPLHDVDRTWVLSNQWGRRTEDTLNELIELAPGFSFRRHAPGSVTTDDDL